MKPIKPFAAIILSILIVTGCGESERIIAFRNVNLVPLTAEKIIENQTVLVKGDRIFKIESADSIKVPQTAVVIEGQGAYLMPGLADMHVHLKGEWPIPQLDLYLANGVTTVRDLDGRDFMLKWRDEIKTGMRSGPTIYVSTPTIRGYEKNAPKLVENGKSRYDCLKLYSYLTKEDYQKIMEIAKKHQLYTIGHIPFAVGLDVVVAAGIDEIAHVEELSFELIDFDRNKNLNPEEWLPYIISNVLKLHQVSAGFKIEDLNIEQRDRLSAIMNKLKAASIPVCTTLTVDEVIVQKLFESDGFLARPQNNYLPQGYKQAFFQGKEKHQVQFKGIKEFAPFKYGLDRALLIELHRSEIPLILGTDAGTAAMGIVPGFSIHDELRILVENGFSPFEAIATGTVNASTVAAAMTGKNEFGTIEVGKRADLILVNKNPLENVAHIKDNRGVMAAGEWYDAAYLQSTVSRSLIPGIPIEGNVVHVRQPDNSFSTIIEIIIGEDFRGKLPDDIDSISVTVTNQNRRNISIALPQSRYFEQFKDFWFRIDGPPELGKYTFEVTSKGSSGTATDYQTVNRRIPLPDISTFSPVAGETLTSKAPTFSWSPVIYPEGELCYRLVINDLTGRRIYGSGRVQNMLSHTVSDGILKPGQTYHYRVRVMDSEDWVEMQNRSESHWLTFTMAETLD
jgi:imidazolonepropionase-like amidohydrolase